WARTRRRVWARCGNLDEWKHRLSVSFRVQSHRLNRGGLVRERAATRYEKKLNDFWRGGVIYLYRLKQPMPKPMHKHCGQYLQRPGGIVIDWCGFNKGNQAMTKSLEVISE